MRPYLEACVLAANALCAMLFSPPVWHLNGRVICTVSPTNLRNLVETDSHFHMNNSPSLPLPIPTRIARTQAFIWASHVRPIPTSIAHTTAKWELYGPNFVDARD